VVLDDTACDLFADTGYSEEYGARELKRTMQRLFETKMSLQILNGKYKSGDNIVCYAKKSELMFRKKPTRGKNQRS
jgi:ATP-dependent Clp protease ATP-binding subunit ClpC